jgi:hypothetical protein
VCDSKVDVVILLDGSGSLGWRGWQAVKSMAKKLSGAFNHPNITAQAQVAVQLFSGPRTWGKYWLCVAPQAWQSPDIENDCGISWVTPLTKDMGHFTNDTKSIATHIDGLTWPASSTLTAMALSQAQAELVYSRPDSIKVVVVITDGKPINPLHTTWTATALKRVARLIWVPVSSSAPAERQLDEWATAPAEQNVVKVDDFTELDSAKVITEMVSDICPQAK